MEITSSDGTLQLILKVISQQWIWHIPKEHKWFIIRNKKVNVYRRCLPKEAESVVDVKMLKEHLSPLSASFTLDLDPLRGSSV